MRNRALRTAGRHRFMPSSQLCNSLLHNWFLNTHSSFGTFNIQGMKRIRVLA